MFKSCKQCNGSGRAIIEAETDSWGECAFCRGSGLAGGGGEIGLLHSMARDWVRTPIDDWEPDTPDDGATKGGNDTRRWCGTQVLNALRTVEGELDRLRCKAEAWDKIYGRFRDDDQQWLYPEMEDALAAATEKAKQEK